VNSPKLTILIVSVILCGCVAPSKSIKPAIAIRTIIGEQGESDGDILLLERHEQREIKETQIPNGTLRAFVYRDDREAWFRTTIRFDGPGPPVKIRHRASFDASILRDEKRYLYICRGWIRFDRLLPEGAGLNLTERVFIGNRPKPYILQELVADIPQAGRRFIELIPLRERAHDLTRISNTFSAAASKSHLPAVSSSIEPVNEISTSLVRPVMEKITDESFLMRFDTKSCEESGLGGVDSEDVIHIEYDLTITGVSCKSIGKIFLSPQFIAEEEWKAEIEAQNNAYLLMELDDSEHTRQFTKLYLNTASDYVQAYLPYSERVHCYLQADLVREWYREVIAQYPGIHQKLRFTGLRRTPRWQSSNMVTRRDNRSVQSYLKNNDGLVIDTWRVDGGTETKIQTLPAFKKWFNVILLEETIN